MTEFEVRGNWIPLMDYAIRKGISLSTLRRYIKSNKVKYRIEHGRYLLLDDAAKNAQADLRGQDEFEVSSSESAMFQSKLQKLERDLRKAQEEIAELKMLIALYEEKISPLRFDS